MPESRKPVPLPQRLMESIAGNLLTDVVRGVLGIVFTAVGSARLIHPACGVLGTAFNFFLIVGGVYLMIYLLIGRAQNPCAEPSKSFRLALREEAGFLLDEFEKIELWNSKADESERLDLLYPLSGNQFPGDVKQWKPLNKELFKWYAMYDCFARMCAKTDLGRLPPLGSLLNTKKLRCGRAKQ